MEKKRSLLSNTFFLYLLTFSNYVFAFITIPYQTRILGPDFFGIISFALAFFSYFLLFIDFGFILSATKSIAEDSDNQNHVGRMLTAVSVSKFLLFVLSLLILFIFTFVSEKVWDNRIIIILYLVLAFFTSITPDFIYRGWENMMMVSLVAVVVRGTFTFLVFLFLKEPQDYILVPIFQIVGVLVSLVIIFYDLFVHKGIRFKRISFKEVYSIMKESSVYFLSRIASTVFTSANTIIIGLIYPSAIVGFYSSAEKFKVLASQAASPISDSLYPYMIRTHNYKTMTLIVISMESLIILSCLILWCYSDVICTFIFGTQYKAAADLVIFFIPLIVLTLPNYVFGFPALTPLRAQKWANYSVEIAMVLQLIGLALLYFNSSLNLYNICWLTIFSESVCFIIRIVAFIVYYIHSKQDNNNIIHEFHEK